MTMRVVIVYHRWYSFTLLHFQNCLRISFVTLKSIVEKFELCASSYFWVSLLTTRLSISILVWVVIQCHTHGKIGRWFAIIWIFGRWLIVCIVHNMKVKSRRSTCEWVCGCVQAQWMHLIQLQWISGDILNAKNASVLWRCLANENFTHIFRPLNCCILHIFIVDANRAHTVSWKIVTKKYFHQRYIYIYICIF